MEFFDGEDPRALIISRNIQTREMSASQKAMLLAVEFPEGGKGGRGKKSETANLLVSSGFSRQLLDQARQINRWAGDEAEGVISGAVKWSDGHFPAKTETRAGGPLWRNSLTMSRYSPGDSRRDSPWTPKASPIANLRNGSA